MEGDKESDHSSPEAAKETKFSKMSADPVTFQQMKEMFDTQAKRIEDSENRIRSDVRVMVDDMQERIRAVQEENEYLKAENVGIKARLLQVERETRKTNLVASGIDFVSPREGFDKLGKVIENAVGKKLRITGIRTFATSNGRKLVAACESVADKQLIMANKKLMKTTTGDSPKPVYIDDDLPKEDREQYGRARELARKMREEGKNVRSTRNRLKIDEKWFYLNPRTNQLEPSTFHGPDKSINMECSRTAQEGRRD